MKVATDGIRPAQDPEDLEAPADRCTQRFKLITWNTGDNRASLAKDLGDDEADNQGNPLVWRNTVELP